MSTNDFQQVLLELRPDFISALARYESHNTAEIFYPALEKLNINPKEFFQRLLREVDTYLDHWFIGICYQEGLGTPNIDHDRSFHHYNIAADLGDAESEASVGLCYLNGYGVRKDATRAATIFQKAAKSGCHRAQCLLGFCYDFGYGVPKNEDLSFEYYMRAALGGHGNAQNNVGMCFHHGTGIGQSDVKAVFWYERAAENDLASGKFHLAEMYASGKGVEKDLKTAFYWYLKSAQSGDVSAQYIVAEYYLNPFDGMTRDPVNAMFWFLKSAEGGSEIACDVIIKLFCDENSHQFDLYNPLHDPTYSREILKIFKDAAENRNRWGQKCLGDCYRLGLLTQKDIHESIKWYIKASDNHCWYALQYMEKLFNRS